MLGGPERVINESNDVWNPNAQKPFEISNVTISTKWGFSVEKRSTIIIVVKFSNIWCKTNHLPAFISELNQFLLQRSFWCSREIFGEMSGIVGGSNKLVKVTQFLENPNLLLLHVRFNRSKKPSSYKFLLPFFPFVWNLFLHVQTYWTRLCFSSSMLVFREIKHLSSWILGAYIWSIYQDQSRS